MKKGDIVDLNIQKLSFGGNGVSRDLDIVGFVSKVAPGDLVKAKITKVKKRFFEAESIQVIKAGPNRRPAPCPVAENCGGCQWQHIDYQEQLNQKNMILRESLQKNALFQGLEFPSLLHAEEFRYRNRIQLRRKNHKIGFLKKASHQLVSFDDCLITKQSIAEKFDDIRSEKNKTNLDKIEIYETEAQEIKTNYNQNHGAQDGFSQVNNAINQQMQKWVLEKVSKIACEEFFDMYAGNGNFARAIESSSNLEKVVAMEWSKSAIEHGIRLSEPDSKIRWIQGKIEDNLNQAELKNTSLALIDPPRIGCDESVINALANSPIENLLYISCNPTTFLRDVERLSAKRDLEVLSIQGLDMFPQTYHIELMCHLRLK